ncbi:protein misato homolog 1-like [Acanthaster planci]|uniref:Protein misato homolog 1-like n=1 Tax=Acanthaster planci TaxID=133434 RepID=A0A8B7ZJ61_ACAPL|nr:protein misato homolog 1-like [Acanthaster planci]
MAGWGREIVTLQCGHYSNFVGTHVWNIQESTFLYDENPAAVTSKEINHDVLYREGRTMTGAVTYTPRLVTLDLKGSLNTLKAEGVLYDYHTKEDIKWEGDVTLHEEKPPSKNEFLSDLDAQDMLCDDTLQGTHKKDDQSTPDTDTMEVEGQSLEGESLPGQPAAQPTKVYHLDESIDVWSDFLHGHLHPKTVMVIKQHAHGSEVDPFGLFTKGRSLLNKKDIAEDIENRLHFFVEECDQLQGFQVLVDFYDGFGGLGSSLVENLADEYKGKGIMAVGVAPAVFTSSSLTADNHRLINSVLAFQRLSEQSSLLLPLSLASSLWRKVGSPVKFQHIHYKPSLAYHTSAILASCLDTATLPYRVVDDPISLSVLTEALGNLGRKVSMLSTSFPLPFPDHGYLASVLGGYTQRPPWTPLTPHTLKGAVVQPFAQSVVLRGAPMDRLYMPGRQPQNALESCRSVNEMLKCYLTGMYTRTLSSGLCVNQPLKTAAPFPHIFDPRMSQEGFIQDWQRREEEAVESIPMMTSLQTSPAAQEMLSHLVKEGSKVDVRKCHGFFEDGMEQDEYSEALGSLESLAHCYEQCP